MGERYGQRRPRLGWLWAVVIVIVAAFAAAPVWGGDTNGARDGGSSNDRPVFERAR